LRRLFANNRVRIEVTLLPDSGDIMDDPLVALSTLQARDNEIREKIESLYKSSPAEEGDELAAAALRYYRLFSSESLPPQVDIGGLTNAKVLYNRYYWFLTYAKRHMRYSGYDAGLEQQAFKLLDQAECEVDWSMVEAIVRRVEREVAETSMG
jgi:hypothetical protein